MTKGPCTCGVCQECDWARNHPEENDVIVEMHDEIVQLRDALEAMLSWAVDANTWRADLPDRRSRQWQKDYARAVAALGRDKSLA